jgi:hypothetical protein
MVIALSTAGLRGWYDQQNTRSIYSRDVVSDDFNPCPTTSIRGAAPSGPMIKDPGIVMPHMLHAKAVRHANHARGDPAVTRRYCPSDQPRAMATLERFARSDTLR